MARSAKTGTDKPALPEVNSDIAKGQAPMVDVEPTPQSEPERSTWGDMPPASEAESHGSAPVLIVEDASAAPESDPVPVAQFAEPAAAPFVMDRPAPPPAPVIVRKTGFLPILLGGLVAAGLGYVAAWQGYGLPVQTPIALTEQMAADTARLTILEEKVAALPAPDAVTQYLDPLNAEIATVRAEMTSAIALISDDIAAIGDSLTVVDGKLTVLERAPAPDGTLADTAIAAWEAELATLRGQMAEQQSQLAAIADAATARLDAAQSTVAQIEQNAATRAGASAAAALQRAAVTRMQAAMDAGTPFDAALADLVTTGVAAPDALSAVAADGVPTLVALADSFPAAARAALATARAEGLANDGEGRVASFFRRQLGVRSVTPREGSDPDAVLSRAEGALREGRLSDAMAEVATLPEVVRAELAGWMTLAEGRTAAVSALQTLSESLPMPDLTADDMPESLN